MIKLFVALVVLAPTVLAQVSPHGSIEYDCQTCHATEAWEMRKDSPFDHGTTGFALTGQHKTLRCASCHAEMRFEKSESSCASCHADVHREELGKTCARCHSTTSWRVTDMVQQHQETRFPLLGRHASVECQSCHTRASEQRFAGTETTCAGCHRNDYQNTKNPNHVAAGFSSDCEQCHRVTSYAWSQGFDHNLTSFPLTGAHSAVSCISCHQNQQFAGTPMQCTACHQSDYVGSTNPNHPAANFSTECQTCHTTVTWQGGQFDHNATLFPLTGAHRQRSCASCHGDNVFAGRPMECISCHRPDYNAAQNPNHLVNGFPQQCETCHSTTGWLPASFDHNTTAFPLSGRHTTTLCQSCHINGNYQLTYQDCYQCHAVEFQLPANPNHVAGNFSHDCRPCHTTNSWLPSTFSHITTQFPLTGAHQAVTCAQCHVNNQYQGLPTECYGCHQDDYASATNPNHVTGNFNHDCLQCHTTAAWSPASFDHNQTNFPLTGSHVAAQCQLCHVNGNYNLVYTNCYPCHQTEYAQPTNPNHVLGNFNHDCATCHTTVSWLPSTFSHGTTAFPLTGAHQAVSCGDCHVNNQYQGLPTECYSCHQGDFAGATNPNHVAGNFSHDCLQCHTTAAWSPASFNHALTTFPLTGRHTTLTCQSCHENGNYQLVYVNCYQCHQSDYIIPTNPNHVVYQFSHECDQCHTTNAWLPSTFNHDQQHFRINSGAHEGKWNSCFDCHPTPGNFANFTCISCHEHRQSEMDDEHRNVPGYVYSSPACLNCHRWD